MRKNLEPAEDIKPTFPKYIYLRKDGRFYFFTQENSRPDEFEVRYIRETPLLRKIIDVVELQTTRILEPIAKINPNEYWKLVIDLEEHTVCKECGSSIPKQIDKDQ